MGTVPIRDAARARAMLAPVISTALVMGTTLFIHFHRASDRERKKRLDCAIQLEKDRLYLRIQETIECIKLTGVGFPESRSKLFADIIIWIQSSAPPERMWLTIGNIGTGKSTINATMAQLLRNQVFCKMHSMSLLFHHSSVPGQANDISRQRFTRSLVRSCRLAGLLPPSGSYRSLLEIVVALTPAPTSSAIARYVILIDDLEEIQSIASLFTYNSLTVVPPYLRFVCTSRPARGIPRGEPQIREYLLDECVSQRYVVQKLIQAALALRDISSDVASKVELLENLSYYCGKCPLYAQYVLNNMLKDQRLPSRDLLSTLPRDINGYYLQTFMRHWPLVMADGSAEGLVPCNYTAARIVLETQSRNPEVCLIDFARSGVTADEILRASQQLAPFVIENTEDVSSMFEVEFVHRSLYEWLCPEGSKQNPYRIEPYIGDVRRVVHHLTQAAPISFQFKSTPRLYSTITKWLGCEPTLSQATTASSRATWDVAKFEASLVRVPQTHQTELLYALELERPEVGGAGFWRMNELVAPKPLYFQIRHIMVMPERFISNAVEPRVESKVERDQSTIIDIERKDLTNGLTPLDGTVDRITHINGCSTDNIMEELINLTNSSASSKNASSGLRNVQISVVRNRLITSFVIECDFTDE